MEDGHIPKDIIYGEPALGRRTTGRPHLRYKDICVRDVKSIDIDSMSWEGLAADRTKWRSALKQHLKTGEDKLMTATSDKRARRKEGSKSIKPETTHTAVNGSSATKTVIPALFSSATIAAATAQQETDKNTHYDVSPISDRRSPLLLYYCTYCAF